MVILHLQDRISNTRPSSQFLDTPGHCLSGALARWKGSVMLPGTWGVGFSVFWPSQAIAPISSKIIKNNIIVMCSRLGAFEDYAAPCCRLSTLAMTSAVVVLSLIKLTPVAFVKVISYLVLVHAPRVV